MDYDKLTKKYGDFDGPAADLVVEGKSFGDNKKDMILGELFIDLSSGYEASEAVVHIYNCCDMASGEYLTEDLKPYILLGSSVTIHMGYLKERTEVFYGFIAQVQFLKSEAEGRYVELRMMDIKGIMMANAYSSQLKAGCYSEAVKEILKKPVYEALGNKGIIGKKNIQDTPDKQQKVLLEMASESDYDFVMRAAKRCGFEFFMEKDTLHFRSAKSDKDELLALKPEQGLLTWEISYDVRGLVQCVEVRGTDDGKGEMVAVQKKFKNCISMGNKAKALFSQTKKVYVDALADNKEQADVLAEALMEKISYRFASLECTCQGLPELLPGHFVRIENLGKPADNLFYITRARHVMEETKGYRTELTGRAASLLKG